MELEDEPDAPVPERGESVVVERRQLHAVSLDPPFPRGAVEAAEELQQRALADS